MAVPLLLDVDTGVDDLVALLYAAASPEVDLIGATTVTGNVHVSTVTRNTLLALETAGLGDVEVARGADAPLVQPWEAFTVVHGDDGLGGAAIREPSGTASERDAATLIVEQARARPGEVLLVATGPLTNVALAVRAEPRLPELLRGFALMGGAFREGGNVTPRAEANVWMDPDAADVVFDAWGGAAPAELPRCFGLDVTERVWLSAIDVEAICAPAPRSPLAVMIRDSIAFYADFHASIGRLDGACMHDPLAVAAAIDPTLCTWADTRVQVELDGRWTRGETVTDLLAIRNTPWLDWPAEENARVATSVDAAAVVARLVERLRSLVAARA
ncbi:MAG TPA: nucleoside hydrolase [Actinomycetota bacterium]|nr:nucleoside hydrolase [Actinomycetota bacterium]